MNLQSITGIYPSNIGSYTQSITGVYNTNTGGGGEYINTDNNIVIDNVSNIINLSTNIITSLTDLSNNKQDNINLIAGNNISISNLNSSWTIEAIASGAEYSNPDNNLVINNVNDTINLSTTINVSNINTSSLTIPINSITKDKITNLNTSLDSLSGDITTLNTSVSGLSGAITTLNTSVSNLSGDITTLNTSVSNLSNNKQDNITLVAGNNISISNLNSSWTIEAIATGGQYSNTDNNLVINNVNDTINLSTSIIVTNLNTSTITIPDNTITKNKITHLNTSLDSLSNKIGSLNTSVSNLSSNKQDNITLVGGTGISISNLNSSWTISSTLTGTNNISVLNNSINLSTSINVSNVNTSTLTIPNNTLTKSKITDLVANLSSINSSITNLNNDKEDNISIVAGNNISILFDNNNNKWTINTSSNLSVASSSDNLSILNGSINLSESIYTYNGTFDNLYVNTSIDMPIESIPINKIKNLTANISSINSSITNLSNDKQNNITLIGGNNITINENQNDIWTISTPSVLLGTNNISVRNGSINLSTNISTNNCSLSNLSVINLLNVNTLKMGTIVTGIIGQPNIACIAQQDYFNNTGYALGQTTGGQTLINSNTSVIKAIKNMEIDGNLNVSNIITKINGNINTSYLVAFEGNISNLDTNETSAVTGYFRYLNASNTYVLNTNTSNLNASNISVRQAYCETTLTSADINVSNINSNIITTGDINVDDISVIENGRFRMKAGSNYGELKTYSTKFNISCSNALYLSLANYNKEMINIYSNNIDLNTDTNISGELNVSVISTSTIATDLVTSSSIVITNMSADNMSGSNMSVLNDLSVGGVLTAPNINLTGLTSLVIGEALMGNSAHGGYAVFCHKNLNTANDYALIQSSGNNYTYLNCRNGGQIRFRNNNNDRMRIRDDGAYNMLELFAPNSGGDTRIKLNRGNGNYWDILGIGNNLFFRFNGVNKFIMYSNADFLADKAVYSKYSYTGYTAYGTNFGMWCKNNNVGDTAKYMALQEQGGDTYLNGYNFLRLRIRNQDKLYVDNNGAYLAGGTAIQSDDRLKFEEQDISGLSIIRQLNPKKYIKIDLPYVKKRRRYYDEYEVSIIDDYIYDICMNEVDKINQERRDISLNDLSSNDYYRDEDYIHKDKITEEDVNDFVTQEDISNGQVECGLIAQEVLETDISWVVHQQKIPEDIQKPLFQPLSVRYDDIYPYCIQAIKELDVLLQKQNNQYNELDVIVQGLRDKVNNLEAENDILLGRVQELENV